MPRLQTALLCNAASQEQSGLTSMLGAFVDTVNAPQLPFRHQLWLVARILLDEADYDQAHTLMVSVNYASDREQIVRIDGSIPPQPPPPPGTVDPDLPVGFVVTLPLALELRRTGMYQVTFAFDADPLWESPLKVNTVIPAI